MEVKICRICKIEKPVDQYYTRKYVSGRVPDSKCKKCANGELNNIDKNQDKIKNARSKRAEKIKIHQNIF